ncbi:MAG: two-component system, OmpR family, sensor kinase [Solirubrobacteraceae bacterium]|nr:two-component system, OmpR family, sensor kinase [Solirubrobacteraceae bacterium]
MEDAITDDAVPLASAAAWSPTAAPQPRNESKILTLDDAFFSHAKAGSDAATREAEPEPGPPPRAAIDRMAALRDIARKLRAAPDSEETLQFVIDKACECTGSDAAMLTVSTPIQRQFVSGTALGAGPYVSVPLRAGGPSFGEIVLTRMSEAAEYESEDETFGELVAEYVAKAITTQRAGTVLSPEEQDFVDRVTEELRSPLAGAVNAISLVLAGQAGELGEDARRYLAAAGADTRRMLATVDALLALAHLRPPELRQMEALPVGPWLERNVERFQEEAAERGVTLTYRPAPEAYITRGVPAELDLVAAQLIGNAIKFTDRGGRVDVTAGLIEGFVRISVRDTGIGFDQAEANRMTDCFARGLTADAARIPGLGIGLFLANEIVKHHGGRLWLESQRDAGTQAHVALPPRA